MSHVRHGGKHKRRTRLEKKARDDRRDAALESAISSGAWYVDRVGVRPTEAGPLDAFQADPPKDWPGLPRRHKMGDMDEEARRRWIERLELLALGDIEPRASKGAAADPISPVVPLIGGLIVSVTLYMLGAVALVQWGGLAAITLGILEIAFARGLRVPPRARALPMIAFLFGCVTIVVGMAVLWL